MRKPLCIFMALLLVLTNTVLAADIHVESFMGQHPSEPELHADSHCDQDGLHDQCHLCCHAQAHFHSLLAHTRDDWFSPGRDWTILTVASPDINGRAPPVPPPKA